MKRNQANSLLKKAASFLILLAMLVGMIPMGTAESNTDLLTPADKTYDNGNVVLHKQALRVGPDEWKVTVKATIHNEPIVRQNMEVVFVVDASGSMAWCTDEEAHKAGSHTHSSKCYGSGYACGFEAHTHSVAGGCYRSDCTAEEHEHSLEENCYEECSYDINPDHYSRLGQRYIHKSSNTDCVSIRDGWSTAYYYLICDRDEHTHSTACQTLTCESVVHTHSNACRTVTCGKDACKHSSSGATACTYTDSNGKTQNYETRLQASKNAIDTMVDNLQNGEFATDVTFKYVVFSSEDYDNGVKKTGNSKVVTSLDALTAEGGTYMYDGINTGLGEFSSSGGTKKVLVVLTDGAADDSMSTTLRNKLNNFKNPDGTNGTVFTIGFAYANDTLAGIAGNGGSYVHAGDEVELVGAMENIESSITAMLVDPMGSAVGFDVGSISQPSSSVSGSVSYNENTLFWNPVGENEFKNATIEYSYVVSLNDSANMEVGSHENVALNKPTSLLYGVKNGTDTQMKEAAFPIPAADYSISSVKVQWQHNGRNIKTETETEKIIADYTGTVLSTGEYYSPSFETDYQTITHTIPQSGHNVYNYIGTTITRNGVVVDAVNPADPAEYVVVHNYELAEMYDVIYEYTGTVPAEAPDASANDHMAKPGEKVTVAQKPEAEGYIFSGWQVSEGGASVSGGSFVMPSNDVKLVGSWEKAPGYQVKVNYYTSTDGGAYVQDNAEPVELTEVVYTTQASVDVSFADAMNYNGGIYGNASLADGSASATVDNAGAKITGIVPADPVAVVVVNLYRELQSSAQYKVNHEYYVVDPDGVETKAEADCLMGDPIEGGHGDVVAADSVATVTVGSSTGDEYTETSRSGDIVLSKDEVKEITITYKRYEYRVTAEGDEGVESITEETVYKAGEDAEVSYAIKDGYELVSVTVDGVDKTGDASALEFAGISANHHVKIVTRKSEASYRVKHEYYVVDPDGQEQLVSEDGFATDPVSGKHGDTVNAASAAAVTIGASTGDEYTEISRSDDIVLDKDAVKEITITYKRYEYRVTTEGDEGVESITEDTVYKAGEDAEVSYAIKDGYELVSVTVDGVDKTGDASALEFAGISANHHVEIVTRKSEASYRVKHEYYVVDPDGQEQLVSEDGFATDPIGGKHGDAVAASSVEALTVGASTGNAYAETGRSDDIVLDKDAVKEITITYKRYEYRVTTEGDEGVESITEDTVYKAGEDAEVSYAIKDGYELVSVTVDGVDKTGDASALEFAGISANHHVEIVTRKSEASYRVKHEYYVVDPDGQEQLVSEDGFATDPVSGKHGDSVSAASAAAVTTGASTGNEYTETSRSGDIVLSKDEVKEITITYKRYEYRVTTEGDEGVESITEDTVYKAGEDAGVSYAIKDGYELVSVTVDGVDKTGDASALEFAGISANHHVEIVTKKSEASYRVKHEYYVVDPDGVERRVEEDSHAGDSIRGKHGDVIRPENVNPIHQGKYSGEKYEETGRSAEVILHKNEEKTITVTYKRYEYRVTIVGDEGVEIIQKGATYRKGENAAVAYGIKDGYELVSVTVNGESAPAVALMAEKDYLHVPGRVGFDNIVRNHDVVVTTSKTPTYQLYVRYQFRDGSTHEGYGADYALYDDVLYKAEDSWSVAEKKAPEGYAFVAAESGQMGGENHDELISGALIGESFGQGNKYVTLVYKKLPSYWIVANYYTINGENISRDNENYVQLKELTYTEDSSLDFDFAGNRDYQGNTYDLPKIGTETTGGTPAIESYVLKGIVPNENTAFVVVELYRDITPEATPTPTPTPTPTLTPTPAPVPENGTDGETTATPAPTANKHNAPPTGDREMMLWSMMALISLAVFVLLAGKSERKKG